MLAIVPVVLSLIPQVKTEHSLICSIVSFALSIVSECVTSFLTKHKDAAIHSQQLFETGVTGSPFSKIEYDREITNELNELAIRKGLPTAQEVEEKYKNLRTERRDRRLQLSVRLPYQRGDQQIPS